jgi:phage shock protein PspC (stress-responsive transcriptional regulator)
MNKTIIININGIIFHIEEDAYEVLQTYMTAVKRHFGYSPDSNEIVSDIENRIAEMFSERINQQKAVITMLDVQEVTAQMGDTSDFEEFDEEGEETGDTSYQYQTYSGRRGLFRDPDDKVIGGVCSGLGHHFDVEAKWIRVAFILLFVLGGSGFLLYIILWILTPLARTRADRMSMRGEEANLHNFKRNFDEEMEGLRKNFSEAGERIRPGLKNTARRTGDALEGIVNIIVKIIGIFVIITSIVIMIGAIIALLGFLGSSGNSFFIDNIQPMRFIDPAYYTLFVWLAFFAIFIPVLSLIMLSIRIITGSRISKYFGYSLLIVWIGSVGFLAYYGSLIGMDHSIDSSVVETSPLLPENVYHLSINDVRTIAQDQNSESSNGQAYTNRIVMRRGGSFMDIRPRIYINKLVYGDTATITKEYSAAGRNFDIASKRAQNMTYHVKQTNGELLFDSHALIGANDLYRDQEIRVDLNIPVGTRLVIDRDMRYRLYNVSFDKFDDSFEDMPSPDQSEWIMTASGLEYVSDRQGQIGIGSSDSTAVLRDSINLKIDTTLKN